MLLENSFVPRDTLIHRLNPLVKFIIFLSIVFLLFLRISFLIHLLLAFFIGLIVWKSECFYVCKKAVPVYLLLIVFLFMVNFVFMKSPGFWTDSRLSDFRDLLGIYTRTGVKNDEALKFGSYFGGEILKSKNGNYWVGDSSVCLEHYLKITNSASSCNHGDHSGTSFTDDFQNLTSFKKWNIFAIDGEGGKVKYAAFAPVWYTVSTAQIIHAFVLANKIIMIIILSAIFTITMSLSSFAYALEDLFRPLKLFKFPTKVMALTVAIAVRFAPSLITEAFRVIKAQASRGIDYKNGKLIDKASALLSLFVPLFVISFMKAGELSQAMISRGYNHSHPRNEYRIYIAKPWELLVLCASMSFITCLYFFFFNSYYCSLFEHLEHINLISR